MFSGFQKLSSSVRKVTDGCITHGYMFNLSVYTVSVPTNDSAEEAAKAGLIAGLVILFLVLIVAGVIGGYLLFTKKFKKVSPNVIDKEKSNLSTRRSIDPVTPSVVDPEVKSPPNSGSHGKLKQVLGEEYTMSSSRPDESLKLQDMETNTASKLPPIETGQTPRETLSPLDTQLTKPALPSIP